MDKFETPDNYIRHHDYWQKKMPKFVFPTTEAIQTDAHSVDDVVKNVKKVVTEVVAAIPTTEFTEAAIPTTELTKEIKTTMIDLAEKMNSSMTNIGQTLNETVLTEMIDSNVTLTEIDNMGNSTLIGLNETGGNTIINEMITTTAQTETTKLMDWLGNEGNEFFNHNLTMTHKEEEAEQNQTLYIILGVILGVLFAISLILLLIYITYKKTNFYTLREHASTDSSHKVVNKVSSHCSKDGDAEISVEYDNSVYKF